MEGGEGVNHPENGYCARAKGCTRPECVENGRKYNRLRSNMRRLGKSTMLPIGPVRAKVQSYYDAGYSLNQLVKAWGCKPDTIIELMKPSDQRERIAGTFGRKVLTVPVEGPPRGRIDATGSMRRVQSLQRDGHSAMEICQLVREREETPTCTKKWVQEVSAGKYQKVRAERHFILIDVFEKLVLTPGNSTQARAYGRRMGWCRPLAWEPEDLDDPNAKQPEDTDVWRCVECGVRLVTNFMYHYRLTPSQRARVKAHGGHGRCTKCYQRPSDVA